MMIDVIHAEEAHTQLLKINALIDLVSDYTERLSTLPTPYRNDFCAVCTNLFTVHDLIYDLTADLDRAIDAAYHKTPGD